MSVSADTMASPPVRKPTSTRWAAIRLRSNRPATTSSTVVTAICVTTRPSRSVQRRPPTFAAGTSPADRPPDSARRLQRGRQAGDQCREHVTPAVKSSTRPSMRSSNDSGIASAGQIDSASRESSAHARRHGDRGATRRQHEPLDEQLLNEPAPAGANRQADADLAPPADARASSMPATLAQAISSTRPTTAISAGGAIGRIGRSACGRAAGRLWSRTALMLGPLVRLLGYAVASWLADHRHVGAGRRRRRTPVFSRPFTNSQRRAAPLERVVPAATARCR